MAEATEEEGGVMLDLKDSEDSGEVTLTPELEQEIEELYAKLGKMNQRDRRKTVQRLSSIGGSREKETRERDELLDSTRQSRVQGDVLGIGLGRQDVVSVKNIQVETTNKRLTSFSGNQKIGNNEVDFKHWKRAALRLLDDEDLKEAQKRRIILSSLTGTAEDLIDLHRALPTGEIVNMLEKLFGKTIDGFDLLSDFYQVMQMPGQGTSEYLNKLYVHLTEVVDLKGITLGELPKVVLRQFIKGTSDEEMLLKLRLDDKVASPPHFADLYALVRKEESRRAERKLRLGKVAKANAVVIGEIAGETNEIGALKQELKETQKKLDQAWAQNQPPQGLRQGDNSTVLEAIWGQNRPGRQGHKPFCFRCGQDNHIAPGCRNVRNPQLVAERKAAREVSQVSGNG